MLYCSSAIEDCLCKLFWGSTLRWKQGGGGNEINFVSVPTLLTRMVVTIILNHRPAVHTESFII